MHQYIKSNIFKVVSFSSYFHLNYSLFGQVLYYTNSLTFQDFFLYKIALRTFYLTILMIIGRGLLLICLFLSRWNQSVSLADIFYCISFWNIPVTTLSLFSFSFPLTPWIRRQFLLEYFSWRSRLLSIVSTFLFKVFTSFFSSEIYLSFFFLSTFISSNFSLMNVIDSLTSSMYLAPLIWTSLRRKAQKYRLPFSPNFASRCIKYRHNVMIVFLL